MRSYLGFALSVVVVFAFSPVMAFGSPEENYRKAASAFAQSSPISFEGLVHAVSEEGDYFVHCVHHSSTGYSNQWYSRGVYLRTESDPILGVKASIAFSHGGKPGKFYSVVSFSSGETGWTVPTETKWEQIYNQSAGKLRKTASGFIFFESGIFRRFYMERYCWTVG